MPPKKKDKKAQKLAEEKAEEERLLLEEIAKQEAEEERKRQEEEERRRKEEERIKAEEAVIRQEQQSKLTVLLSEIAIFHNKKTIEEWNNERWLFYLYDTDKIDALDLRVVNTFLSTWNDDENFEVQHVFDKCHECLQFLEEIRSAIIRCPEADAKTIEKWKETMSNLNKMILKKLDLSCFQILKDGEQYINEDTQNIEYGIKDSSGDKEGDHNLITMVLFGNIYKKTRRRELEIFELHFILPYEAVMEDCVVRLMHTLFDPVSSESQICIEPEPPEEPAVSTEIPETSEEGSASTVATDVVEKALSDTEVPVARTSVEMEKQEPDLGITKSSRSILNTDTLDSEDVDSEEIPNSSTSMEVQGGGSSIELKEEEDSASSGEEDMEYWAIKYPLPDEIELETVNEDEYFSVGGTFHFGLYAVPTPTVSTGCWIFQYSEEEELQHLSYKTVIVPPRPLDDVPPADRDSFENYEKARFQKEITNAIVLDLKLPDSVLYLEDPIPVRYITNRGFSSSEIFEPKYYRETNRVQFKTNRFGVFSVMQRKYANMPYKSWSMTCENKSSIMLTINGAHVAVTIEITAEGCCVRSLQREGDLAISDLTSEWMTSKELIIFLRFFGVNIAVEKNSSEYIGTTPKISQDRKTEEWTCKCMSLLCQVCNFSSIPLSSITESNQFLLQYDLTIGDTKGSYQALITPMRATSHFSQKRNSLSPEKIPDVPFSSDLYHLITSGLDEKLMKEIDSIDYSLAQNVCLLLLFVRPFTCLTQNNSNENI